MSAALLVPLLAAIWGARGEPPGQITTGAIVNFGGGPVPQYPKVVYDGVQGLRYFATTGTHHVPSVQQPILVYPGSVVGAGPVLIPTQVGVPSIAGINKGGPYYGYIVPTTPSPQSSFPTYPPYPAPPAPPPPPPPPPPPSPPPPPPPPPPSSSPIPIPSVYPTSYPASPPSLGIHNNVDITYDSLQSQTQNGPNYSPPSFTTPTPSSISQVILSSSPPMHATTYGPPKPVVLRPYITTRNRGAYILGPAHHHVSPPKAVSGHYHHLIPVQTKQIHSSGLSNAILIKAKPHYPYPYPHPPKQPLPPPVYNPPIRKPQVPPVNSISSASHPDITKAIFHSQPVDSYAAAAAYSSSQTGVPYATNPPQTYNPGTGHVPTHSYYIPVLTYPLHRSDDLDTEQNSEDIPIQRNSNDREYEEEDENNLEEEGEYEEEKQTNPVFIYRPTMRHYENSEYMSPSKHKEEVMDRGNILGLDIHSSSSWMPINAPEGAVPARAYEIPAPDLSRGNSEYTDGVVETANRQHNQIRDFSRGHRGSTIGKVAAVPISHGDHFNIRTDGDNYRRDLYKGNSEEVVSAVVLVKQ